MDAGTGSIVHEFNRLVMRYFALFTDRSTERTAWLRQAEIAIAELYGAGLRLPKTEPSDRDAPQIPIEDQRRLMTEIVHRYPSGSCIRLERVEDERVMDRMVGRSHCS